MLKKYPKLVVLLILGSTLLCMSCASSENDSLINVSGPGDVPGGGTDTSNVACSDSVQASGFNGGDGTEADPYLICNYVQLVKIRDDLSAHYRLTQNIDASSSHSEGSERDASTDGDSDCTAYNPGAAASTDAGHPEHGDSCRGWAPVGNSGNPFSGRFDGAGYAIQNLYQSAIGGHTRYAGLFGYTGSSAEIRNLGIEKPVYLASPLTLSATPTPTAVVWWGIILEQSVIPM